MKPICVSCQCFYRPKRNGFTFIESMPAGGTDLPPEMLRGRKAPRAWKPYKLWRGDLWECPECSHKIISGVANEPILEHWHPKFEAAVESLGGEKLLRVNDC